VCALPIDCGNPKASHPLQGVPGCGALLAHTAPAAVLGAWAKQHRIWVESLRMKRRQAEERDMELAQPIQSHMQEDCGEG
jgi:hypothetical protein